MAAAGGPCLRSGQDPGASRTRVLCVDDDMVDRLTVRRYLAGRAEIEVEEADGVLAAIERLTAERFDCVLLDYNLPDGDGLTFLRGLRAAGIEVPVLILTGQQDPEVVADLMVAGAAGYLPKAQLSAELLLVQLQEAMRAAD